MFYEALAIDEVVTQIKIVAQIARCIQLKKVLTSENADPHLNFWRLMYGGLLDLSVLEWIKIFGSKAEPSHWKRVVTDQAKFRSDLLQSIGCTEKEWANYWNSMKGYRDEHVAHHSASPTVMNYPKLDMALESCYFYYDYLIKKARASGETKFPDDLKDYCQRFSAQSADIAKAAMSATAGFQELVF